MGVIVNTEGRPIFDEVASITRDVRRVFYGGVQFNEDDVLKARGGAKGLKLFQELKTDAHAGAVLAKRKLAVTARPWEVHPASERRRDKAAAELVKNAFEALKFNSLRKRLLEATLTGYAVCEVMWEVRDGLVLPRTVKARDPRRFIFTTEDDLRLLTREAPLLGEELPDRKFIVHRRGADDDSPYGTGIGGMLFWPVFFKRNGITFWLTFADKFGAPTVLGKYPPGAGEAEKKKLMDAMRAVSHDAGVMVPEGMLMELVEAKRSGGVDTYAALVAYMDEQISKAVLGETMSTTAQAAGMGSGQANVHDNVRMEVARDDAGELDETLTDSLVRWIVHYNMPDAGVPKLCTQFDEPEDTAKLAERDSKLHAMGFEPSEEYVAETYPGWTKPAKPEPVVPGTLAATDPADLDPGGEADPNGTGGDGLDEDPNAAEAGFADGAGAPLGKVSAQRGFALARKEAISQAAERLAGDWQDIMRKPVDDLLAQFEASRDLVEFRLRLTQLLDAKPDPATVEKLARASFGAHLQGRGPASQAQKAKNKPGLLKRLAAAVRGR